MLITVKTFDSHNINDGTNYRALLLNPHGTPDAVPVLVEQPNADSIDVGLYTVNVQNKVLSIEIRNYASRYSLISQLKTWFKRGTEGDLVVTFADDGVDYQLSCRVINTVQNADSPQYFTVILQTGTSAWRAVTETTHSTWTVTGTTETEDISVGGKDETFLSIDLTTVAAPANGYLYQQLYQLTNVDYVAQGLIPWCITVNTAALVSAGKMQADCDDLRIVNLNTGQEVKRWISNPNNAATKVWVNLDMVPGFTLVLSANVASSGDVDYLEFNNGSNPSATAAYMATMPATGIMCHGTEWFAYDRVDAPNRRLYISKRGLFGTTQQAHNIGDSFLYVQYPLAMKYGNGTVSAPSSGDSTYDDEKPLFSLSSSTNASWVWSASDKFYDPDHPNRTGGWLLRKRSLGDVSEIFLVKRDALSGDAAIGLTVANFLVGSTWKDENVELVATLYRATGFTSISTTGEKYRTNANWISAGLWLHSPTAPIWTELWAEATPASPSTWTTWTHNSVSVTGALRSSIELWFWGGYSSIPPGYATLEMLTCTATFDSTWLPTGAFLGGEKLNYPLDATLENLTNGDSIRIDYMMLIGKTFSLDGEQNLVQYDGYSAYDVITTDDEGRSAYLRLQGGVTNQIKITGAADLGTLSVVLSWYRRRL